MRRRLDQLEIERHFGTDAFDLFQPFDRGRDHAVEIPEGLDQAMRHGFYIAVLQTAEEQQFEQFVIRQWICPADTEPVAQAFPMTGDVRGLFRFGRDRYRGRCRWRRGHCGRFEERGLRGSGQRHSGRMAHQPFMESQKPFTDLKKLFDSGLLSSLRSSNSRRSSFCFAVRLTGVSTASSMNMSLCP